MSTISVRVSAHWSNGWFLRLFSRPYVVVEGKPRRVVWGELTRVAVGSSSPALGAGVRYFGRGPLLGCEPDPVDLVTVGEKTLEFRNGLLNHTPFRIVRLASGSAGSRA